jgi:hypothetical protein
MDGLRWMSRNEWLAMEISVMEPYTAHYGQLAMDSSAMERWTARQYRDGRLAMDGSAMERWTACNGRLGDGRLGGGSMYGSQHIAAFLLQIFQD